MKPLNKYIKEKLIINKDYKDCRYHDNMIVIKSFDELRKIIKDRYDKLGPGTEQDPVDFNDIDVSNLDSFYNDDKGIFEGTKFNYIDISDWDVSNIKSMRSMFFECKKLKSVGDLSNWDVSNVTDMNSMFWECEKLELAGDLSNLDVSSVTNMGYMFAVCENFNKDISKWDVSKVLYKSCAFDDCPIKSEYKPKFK